MNTLLIFLLGFIGGVVAMLLVQLSIKNRVGLPDGTKFNCPLCNRTVVDQWVTSPRKGSVIRCPVCKTSFRLLKVPGEKTPGEMLEILPKKY